MLPHQLFRGTKISHLVLVAFATLALLPGCGEEKKVTSVNTQEEAPVVNNSKENAVVPAADTYTGPVRFYFTPSVDEKIVRQKGTLLLDFLSKETGYTFELHITKNYDEMVRDFESGKADVGIMNSLSYLKVNRSCGANARLRAIRYGKSTYFGQIIAREGSINNISELNGKTIAYTDSLSTSGYLFPQKILVKNGVKPGKTFFAGKHDDVVRLVYEGKVDAGATFYSEPAADGTIRDARARVMDKYPDVARKVKILAITDPIPNDPVVFSSTLSQDLSYKISLGIIKFVATAEGKDVLSAIYSTEGFVRCSDSDYDILRSAIQ